MLDKLLTVVIVSVAITGCSATKPKAKNTIVSKPAVHKPTQVVTNVPVVFEKRSPKQQAPKRIATSQYANSFNQQLSNAAINRLRSRVRYDGSYVKIAYPGGDVPQNIGVCTDVVIRSYRKLGIDLQEQVHRDMSAAFHTYPNPRKWGLSRPDTNIDHRRVYNLRHFFQRRGAALPISRNPRNYKPGDLVTWMVGPDLPHIGVVVNQRSKADPNRLMIVHNIAHGPKMEDILFRFPITGHYRYTPAHMNNIPQGAALAAHRSAPRNNSMSYAQLVSAANLLGTGSTKPATRTSSNKPSNKEIQDQVVRLNNSKGPVVKAKNSSMQLATLTDAEIQSLLTK